MLDTSNDKHFPRKMSVANEQEILDNCAAHQTMSESVNYKDIDFDTADEESVLSDATDSEEVQNPNNISLWEEGLYSKLYL